MSVQKNPIFLADILAPLRGRNWRVVFIGDGPLRPELEHQLQRAGIAGQCELRGWLGNTDVRATMARSDILLMPSLSEGMPVAAVEAASLGLAIAGSQIPGLTDVLHDGINGWTLPLADRSRWTNLFGTLLNDSTGLRERQENSLQVARRFDLAGIISSYEEALLSALHK
jgi:glycosyltransferase involved in cell wall biosynthesis